MHCTTNSLGISSASTFAPPARSPAAVAPSGRSWIQTLLVVEVGKEPVRLVQVEHGAVLQRQLVGKVNEPTIPPAHAGGESGELDFRNLTLGNDGLNDAEVAAKPDPVDCQPTCLAAAPR